ncbi:MAG: 2-amino-4-hydroxy-6-hydroxymethyldihydropteridine diphosphokinase [Flavobacteriales bacterium]|nr:2-amino-4-hydroxy-6-hydroxymethyldihydropteridine diphosphokinase [Flavobacteriales bacterium]
MASQVVIALGANLGDVELMLDQAVRQIGNRIGSTVLRSGRYVTKAWGVEDQPDYLNQVVAVSTTLTARQVLDACMAIEEEMGRIRMEGEKWGSRVIDLDILFYEDCRIDEPDLKIPHPYLHHRNFVLYPLHEILPDFIHPGLNKSIRELLTACSDSLEVKKI